MKAHSVVDINGRHYTASDGTEGFVYREVVRSRSGWKTKTRGSKGTIKALLAETTDREVRHGPFNRA